MARRKVIADSEDEDEGDEVSLPDLGDDFDPPEAEPLSPRRGQQLSDDNQQDLAAQQSRLIENIVRQSQRASASSGHVELPSKKTGRRVAPSSGATDVTSPIILSKPRNRMAPFNHDVSNFATPRKSMGQVWDIPSSPDDGTTAPRSAQPTSGKEKTSGKAKKGPSRLASSPVPADMLAVEDATPKPSFKDPDVDHLPEDGPGTGLPSTPAAGRTKVSHHDSTLPDTKFYIAQSNLTTMQKLEYQRVNMSLNSYGGLPGSLPHYKSSGATTIPYPTPTGYSPVPPLPWEEPPEQPSSPQRGVITNINSSPDVIGNGFDLPNERSPVPNRNCKSPVRAQSQTPVSKGKKRAPQDDEDELGRDDIWDPHDIDAPQDSYKPRPTKRRAALAATSDIGSRMDTLEHISNEALIDTQGPPESPAPPEAQPEPQPKKRGRKKKQPATEYLVTETDTNEELNPNQNPVSPEKTAEAEPSPERPKKRRGRPRKSEPSKITEEEMPDLPPTAPPPPELPPTAPPPTEPPQEDDDPDTSAAVSRKQENSKKTKKKKSKATEEVEDTESDDDRPPLTEVDGNLRSPSKSVSTKEETPARSRAGSSEEKSIPKAQSKEAPKSATSQSKPTYRVGLSKRSRIAPLLKSIKK